MKTKILNALKTEYKNLGLSEKALDGVASFLVKTITDESGIDAAIKEASVAGMLRVFQSDIDSERGKASKATKDLDDYKKAHPDTTTPPPASVTPPVEDETAKTLREMKEQLKALQDRNAALDKEKSQRDLMAQVRANLEKDNRGFAGLLDMILANPAIGDTDTAETLTEKYKGIYDEKYKVFYGDGAVPPAGAQNQAEQGYKKGQFSGVIAALRRSGDLPPEESK